MSSLVSRLQRLQGTIVGREGAQGAQGSQGVQGPQGAAGPSNVHVVPITSFDSGTSMTLISGRGFSLTADCSAAGVTITLHDGSGGFGAQALASSSSQGQKSVVAGLVTDSATVETVPAGVDSRADVDIYSGGGGSGDGQYLVFATPGGGCHGQASASVSG